MKKIIDNSEVGVRSNQNLSFNWLGSADFGRLVPFHWQELLPTDKVKRCKPKIELQMLPLASPTFGKIDLYVHYFFVPTRLIWKDAPDFFSQSGEGQNATPPYWTPGDFSAAYVNENEETPVIELEGKRPLFKHWTSFGLPPFFTPTASQEVPPNEWMNQRISVLPLRAYNQIWWDFYRDTELIPDSNKSQYLIDSSGYTDYYTGGNPYIPYGRSIKDTWISELFVKNGMEGVLPTAIFTPTQLNPDMFSNSTTTIQTIGRGYPDFGNIRANSSSVGDGNNVIGELTSPEIRKIEALTRLSERLSLSGKRQIDKLYSLYGVKPEFSKLNMCQYVGGAKCTVLVSDITATASSGTFAEDLYQAGSVLGQKAGSGYANFRNLNVNYTAGEHGYLIGMFSVMPHVHFVQGLGKEWFRNSLFDWFRRELEHTGQVAVPRKEVGCRYGGSVRGPLYQYAKDNETFAFTQPYYEYKRKQDVLAGDFMYYHNQTQSEGSYQQDIAYMQSMGMYIDYPVDRLYNAENMILKGRDANKIFYYLGGNIWENADDHFFINCDVDCLVDRPMDGFAVPTLETTEDPHLKTAPVGSSTQL